MHQSRQVKAGARDERIHGELIQAIRRAVKISVYGIIPPLFCEPG